MIKVIDFAGIEASGLVLATALALKGLGHSVVIRDCTSEKTMQACFPEISGLKAEDNVVTNNGISYTWTDDDAGCDVRIRLLGDAAPGSGEQDALVIVGDEQLTTIARLEEIWDIDLKAERLARDKGTLEVMFPEVKELLEQNGARSSGCLLLIKNYIGSELERMRGLVWGAVVTQVLTMPVSDGDYRYELYVEEGMSLRKTHFSTTYRETVRQILEAAGINTSDIKAAFAAKGDLS